VRTPSRFKGTPSSSAQTLANASEGGSARPFDDAEGAEDEPGDIEGLLGDEGLLEEEGVHGDEDLRGGDKDAHEHADRDGVEEEEEGAGDDNVNDDGASSSESDNDADGGSAVRGGAKGGDARRVRLSQPQAALLLKLGYKHRLLDDLNMRSSLRGRPWKDAFERMSHEFYATTGIEFLGSGGLEKRLKSAWAQKKKFMDGQTAAAEVQPDSRQNKRVVEEDDDERYAEAAARTHKSAKALKEKRDAKAASGKNFRNASDLAESILDDEYGGRGRLETELAEDHAEIARLQADGEMDADKAGMKMGKHYQYAHRGRATAAAAAADAVRTKSGSSSRTAAAATKKKLSASEVAVRQHNKRTRYEDDDWGSDDDDKPIELHDPVATLSDAMNRTQKAAGERNERMLKGIGTQIALGGAVLGRAVEDLGAAWLRNQEAERSAADRRWESSLSALVSIGTAAVTAWAGQRNVTGVAGAAATGAVMTSAHAWRHARAEVLNPSPMKAASSPDRRGAESLGSCVFCAKRPAVVTESDGLGLCGRCLDQRRSAETDADA